MAPVRFLAAVVFVLAPTVVFGQGVAAPEQPSLPVLVVDVTQASPAERLTAASIQGLANRQARLPAGGQGPNVFLITRTGDEKWLDYSLLMLGRPAERISVSELVERLKTEIGKQVLYDPDRPYTVDVATTAAGVYEALMTDTDLGLPTALDVRGKWKSAEEAYQWAFDNLLPKCQERRGAVMPAEAMGVRDYLIQQRMFTISAPTSGEDPLFADFLFRLTPGSTIYGRLPDVVRGLPSQYSHSLVSVSDTANLSFLSRVTVPAAARQYVGYLELDVPRYLTLIFDCSDVDFAVNELPGLWDDPVGGTMPLGWALPAALAEAAPPVLHRYYADTYRSGLDQFVLGPSGAAEMDVSAARSPYSFYEASSAARARMDAQTSLFDASTGTQELDVFVPQFISETGVRGVFVVGGGDFDPYLYGETPAIAAPRVSSLKQAVDYLDNFPPARRFAVLCLDPRSLTPSDAAHLAAYLGNRFVVVGPEELVEAIRNQPVDGQEGMVVITSAQYPEGLGGADPVPITAEVANPEAVRSLTVVYHPANHWLAFAEPMEKSAEGYLAELPPLLYGGEFDLAIRAVDSEGRVSWSGVWQLSIPWEDSDEDGLSDAEERFLLTEASLADTDGDGLMDGNDLSPLRYDRVSQCYFGPLRAPSEGAYLVWFGGGEGGAEAQPQEAGLGRQLRSGGDCVYWLSAAHLPQGSAVVEIDGTGEAEIALSRDFAPQPDQPSAGLGQVGPIWPVRLEGIWHSPPLQADEYPAGVFVHITCPSSESGSNKLALRSVALISPPGGPSIAGAIVSPAHPGPEQPVYVSAQVFCPKELAEVSVSYRVNNGGIVTFPMQPLGWRQRYGARLPSFDNRDEVEWWIAARDSDGNVSATPTALMVVGSWARETASLVATREFAGDWSPDTFSLGGGQKTARSAAEDGLIDTGPVNLTGGNYAVWVLAGGRGRGIGVYVDEKRVGGIDPKAPDGWQKVGKVRLDAGHYHVQMISEAGAEEWPGGAARYAAVVLSADPNFKPPAGQMLDVYNSMALLSPAADQVLGGRMELKATGSGNVIGAQFSIDGELLKPVFGPPFTLSVSTSRYENGSHTLRVQGLDRAGPMGLALEIPVTIAN